MEMQTDKAVVPLANAQHKYARNTHSGFINLYELMGGKGSMKQWVEANPSLASKDYTHFNARGAKKVAHLLYNKLMEEYEHYKDPHNTQKADAFGEKIKEIQEVHPTTVTATTAAAATTTRTEQPTPPVRQPAAEPVHPVQQTPASQRIPKDTMKPKKTDLYEL